MAESGGTDAGNMQLVVSSPSPNAALDAEQRIREAEELEAKLTAIQENVPTRIFNVCASAAGAGSGDFHQYRMIRRREQLRLRRMEEEFVRKEEQEQIRAKLARRNAVDEARTSKRRAKRQKRKVKKQALRSGAATETLGFEGRDQARDESGVHGELGENSEVPEQVELD